MTLRDVAERAGVSTAAISQALNDRGSLRPETRERIKAIAAELGYTPNKHAAALRSGRTMSIGFVMPAVGDAAAKSWAFAHNLQLNALVRASAEHGFTVTVLPASRPDLLATAQLDALYLADARTGAELLRAAASRGLPVIARDLYVDVDRALSIRTGYDAALRAALDHLSATGAERIALLVDEGNHPRDEIARSGYVAWSTVHGADPLVIPRDVQLLALCSTDCALNERLGVTHACVHPELAADAVFPSLSALVPSPGGAPRVVDLPWELVRGSTTR